MEDTTKEEISAEVTVEEQSVKKTRKPRTTKVKTEQTVVPQQAEGNHQRASKGVVLMNTSGKAVNNDDYFFGGVIPPGFDNTCGKPVDREDLVEVFNKVFNPADNILFYKQSDKEVYLVIIPIKNATTIGDFNNSFEGDFQKHAISFLNEGSVNLDTLKMKLQKINKFVKYTDR